MSTTALRLEEESAIRVQKKDGSKGIRRGTKPGAATGTCACGFGMKSHAKWDVQYAADFRRAPFTPKPGHMPRSPRLALLVP